MTTHPTESKPSFAADPLAVGMLVMLAMTVVQRGLGFFRGVWFCRMLDDGIVGQWAMAFGFITLITPVMLLGIPGSLPRYVEHYRLRGHLSAFVRRLLIATVTFGVVFIALMLMAPQWFGWLIFLQPLNTQLVYSVAVAVTATIAFNFVYQLVSSLRQVRVASMMQFVQGVGFTVIGIIWLSLGGGINGLVLSFAAATTLAMVPGGWSLILGWRGLPRHSESFDSGSMWRRLLPYASALWAMNLLTNVFVLSDRYMILHFSLGDEMAGQAAVGQYHSGRIIPELLMSLAVMFSGVLLPYLSADWEAGRRDAVRARLRRILLAVSASFTAGAAVALVAAPWLFSTLLEDRYSDGLALMPMAFVFCIWAALTTIGQDYFWVIERGRLVTASMGIGLLVNLGMNYWLLPIWGLHGAVLATLCAHGVVMIMLWIAMARYGYGLDRTTLYVSLMPATLLAGPWVAMLCVAISLAASPHARLWSKEAFEGVLAKRGKLAAAAIAR